MAQSNDDKSSNQNKETKISESQQMEEKLRMKEKYITPLPLGGDRRSLERRLLDTQIDAIKKNPLGEEIINSVQYLGEKFKEKITPGSNLLGDKLRPESEEQKMINDYNNKPDFLKTHRTPNDKTPSYSNLDPEILKEINSAGRELLNQTPPPSNRPRPNSKGDKGSIGR